VTRLGVLGGTFDPPHLGHLVVASDVYEGLGLDRLLLVPSADPPHKQGRVAASAEQRLRMTRAAVLGDPRFEVDDLELRRSGLSYSVDTVRAVREREPGCELYFVMGVDQLRELHTWHRPEELARLASLVAIPREGETRPESPYPVSWLPVTRIDLSATEIRRRVAAGRSIRYLVPEVVREIIEAEGLYG
jgi:nicotinate-nucleotide adenylyltransferase